MLGAFANNEQGVILYQYGKNIGFNKGLLLDCKYWNEKNA